MEAAYIFGHLGNLANAMGSGWSVEDAFAWVVGDGSSELTLPLPGDEVAYVLRFDVHPALFPPDLGSQGLTIMAGGTRLAHFEMKGRQTIAVPLPPDLTRGRRHLALTFLHPDAARPCDHGAGDDSRILGFCFHSASLAVDGEDAPFDRVGLAPGLEPMRGLIIGGPTALQIVHVITGLPCLKERFGLRFVDASKPLSDAVADLPAGTLETSGLCWTDLSAGTPATRDALRARLPPDCVGRTFHTPTCQVLWPFRGQDSRAVPEPGLYPLSRYPHSDRLAQALAGIRMGNDLLYLMYESLTDKEPLDLNAMFADDLARWRQDDDRSDIRLAAFIATHFRSERLFVSPDRVGPALLREMVWQILDEGLVRDVVSPTAVAADLDELLEGFTGQREEVPVHPRVAQHFDLPWWSPGLKYRWMNNLLTHQDYVLNLIKWTPWRP